MDSSVPLAMSPNLKKIVLTGDHQQLRPMVRAVNSEYSKQIGLSMFERALRVKNVPLFRLKVNYRIHPEIALLPGMLSYQWLGCDRSTTEDNEAYEYVKSFWHSEKNREHKNDCRRKGEWTKKPSQKFRRMFFDVKDSSSAMPDDSTSFVNFGVVQAIVRKVTDLLDHYNVAGDKVERLDPSQITIITGYVEEKKVLEKLLKLVLESLGWDTFPQVVTIDSIQGGQNDIVIFSMTAANPRAWIPHRIPQGMEPHEFRLHSCQAVPLDVRKSRLVAPESQGHRRLLVHFVIDLLGLGDIIDVTLPCVDKLSADESELSSCDLWVAQGSSCE
ncbi:uncharacterized protein PAC_19425 [Phialocephala subalpina]|uniref:DNA2/NAM7 helicase-like C-terminal domain-containing protein n=1 Tax=Phialocephala subalpina TaxID=576137 RepID=A0A1L7XX70_9HELO|nr:uncharacterized protein PAC_19425 [Phialocephala subalpina]